MLIHCNSRYSLVGKKLFMFAKNFFSILLSDEKILVIIQSSPTLLFFYLDKAKQIFSRECCTVCALSMKCNPLKMSSLLDPKMCQRFPVLGGLDNWPLGLLGTVLTMYKGKNSFFLRFMTGLGCNSKNAVWEPASCSPQRMISSQ
jgi:hypothetical protein